MSPQNQPIRFRFESFELDLRTQELRKEGRVVKVQDQPLKLLALLAGRPGELVTRAEIEKALWTDGEFVEFEHSINTAMRKIREALGDDLEKPRFIETLPRKGYRFIAAVESTGESMGTPGGVAQSPAEAVPPIRSFRDKIPVGGSAPASYPAAAVEAVQPDPEPAVPSPGANSTSAEEFSMSRPIARTLFLVIQAGYLAMYCAALYRAEAIEELAPVAAVTPILLVSAMCGIAVRLYLLSAVGLDHPAAGIKFRRLFPSLFVLDALWSAAPLLLVREIGYGLALGSVAALAYLPFAQRTLLLSASRNPKHVSSATNHAGS